jgi:ABC-2 type transport system permease protein
MLGAGLNVVPTALVVLGIGTLVLSVSSRRAALSVYAVVIWSLVVDLAASLVSSLQWLERLTLFHYVALVPARNSDPWNLVITSAIAVALCAAETAIFQRRDLQLT